MEYSGRGTPWRAPTTIFSRLLCDVCDLLATGLECTGAPGTPLQGAMVSYRPSGGMYGPPTVAAKPADSGLTLNVGEFLDLLVPADLHLPGNIIAIEEPHHL